MPTTTNNLRGLQGSYDNGYDADAYHHFNYHKQYGTDPNDHDHDGVQDEDEPCSTSHYDGYYNKGCADQPVDENEDETMQQHNHKLEQDGDKSNNSNIVEQDLEDAKESTTSTTSSTESTIVTDTVDTHDEHHLDKVTDHDDTQMRMGDITEYAPCNDQNIDVNNKNQGMPCQEIHMGGVSKEQVAAVEGEYTKNQVQNNNNNESVIVGETSTQSSNHGDHHDEKGFDNDSEHLGDTVDDIPFCTEEILNANIGVSNKNQAMPCKPLPTSDTEEDMQHNHKLDQDADTEEDPVDTTTTTNNNDIDSIDEIEPLLDSRNFVPQSSSSDDPFGTTATVASSSGHSDFEPRVFWGVNGFIFFLITLACCLCWKRGNRIVADTRTSDEEYQAELMRRQQAAKDKLKTPPHIREKQIKESFKRSQNVMVVKESDLIPPKAADSTVVEKEEKMEDVDLENPAPAADNNTKSLAKNNTSSFDDDDFDDDTGFLKLRPDNNQTTEDVTVIPNMCAICLGPYSVGETVVWSPLGCPHVFHQGCLTDWFMKINANGQSQGTPCPCCRQEFTDLETVVKESKITWKAGNAMNMRSVGLR